jgi:hypothetical protein
MARVDRAARGAKGQVGAAIDVPRQMGLLFRPTTPGLVRCNDFKDASKAAAPSSTDSTGVAIPNAKTLIEYHAVALEMVREHPWLTEIGSRQRPRQHAFTSSHLQVALRAPMAASSRPWRPAVPRIVAIDVPAQPRHPLLLDRWAVS